jgi:hypothetical protein
MRLAWEDGGPTRADELAGGKVAQRRLVSMSDDEELGKPTYFSWL